MGLFLIDMTTTESFILKMNLLVERIMRMALNPFGLLLKGDLLSLTVSLTKISSYILKNVSLGLIIDQIIYIVFH